MASPLVVLGGKVIAVTDRTTVLFEPPAAASGSLRRIGEAPLGDSSRRQPRYALAAGERLWIGGAGLRQYEVRTSGDLLTQISATFPDSAILGPPLLLETQIAAVRHDTDPPNLAAFGLQASDLKPVWNTTLALPAAPAAQP
jgi:hypothetical protein